MATPSRAISLDTTDTLSELYLGLWKLVGGVSGENKWMDIRPERPEELRQRVQRLFESVHGNCPKSVIRDYQKATRLASQGVDDSVFRDYLGEMGLRYDELADVGATEQ